MSSYDSATFWQKWWALGRERGAERDLACVRGAEPDLACVGDWYWLVKLHLAAGVVLYTGNPPQIF